MYIPSYFNIADTDFIYDTIQKHGFATLFSQHKDAPFATHLPLMLGDNRDYLYGHFARPNPQWKDVEGQTVLAVFHGPHCYISPSWYETHRAVPTWNYISVHVYGKIEWMNGGELADSLSDLVRKYEAPGSSYRLDEVDEEFLKGLNHGIVGFKIKIENMEGKAKLSQNHSIERQKLVIQKLERIESENEQQIAAHMNELLQKS